MLPKLCVEVPSMIWRTLQLPSSGWMRWKEKVDPLHPTLTLKMDNIMYTKTLERLQHIIWVNFKSWILVFRISEPAPCDVYPNCVSKLFQCFEIPHRCHLRGEWGVLWDLYIRSHPLSVLFTLKMVTEMYTQMLKQFHHMVQLNPKAIITCIHQILKGSNIYQHMISFNTL
jgi:hypothetical protein